jgi:hypothetical protein
MTDWLPLQADIPGPALSGVSGVSAYVTKIMLSAVKNSQVIELAV